MQSVSLGVMVRHLGLPGRKSGGLGRGEGLAGARRAGPAPPWEGRGGAGAAGPGLAERQHHLVAGPLPAQAGWTAGLLQGRSGRERWGCRRFWPHRTQCVSATRGKSRAHVMSRVRLPAAGAGVALSYWWETAGLWRQ